MADLTLAPSINDARGKAILAITDQRMKALDLTPILVYRIPNLPNSAVLAMAWQWDVLDPSWALGIAAGEAWDVLSDIDSITNIDTLLSNNSVDGPSDYDTYRQLIQNSVPLHKLRGTPAAILTALANLGFGLPPVSGYGGGGGVGSVTILEGQNSWGGTAWPANEGWAVFRIVIALGNGQAITARQINQIIGAANFWKPARCWLDALQFTAVPLTDLLLPAPSDVLINIFAQVDLLLPAPSDTLSAPAWPLADTKTIIPLHDTRYLHIGTTYDLNEPAVADSGVVVNGVAISANG
jgi:tail protein P2 I